MATDSELKAMEAALSALQSLSPDEQQRVLDWLASRLGLGDPSSISTRSGSETIVGDSGRGELGTIKQFLKGKRPDNDVARATVLAYYLTHASEKETFTSADLSKARADAALPSFNVSRGTRNARAAGYLTSTGKCGTDKITYLGESLVEAMPDKEGIKKITLQRRKPRRKATKRIPAGKRGSRS